MEKARTPLDTQAREESILGKPPRILPLSPEEIGPAEVESLNTLRSAINSPPIDKLPDFTATMLKHPALYQGHNALALELFRGALELRDRQLAILRTEWLCQTPFAFGSHVNISKRLAGITTEEIERVVIGSSARGWNEHDRAILKAVEEMFADARISEGTWAILAKRLDERQLIELPILVGQYQGVAYIQNSIGVRLMPGNRGLSAR